MHQLTTAYCCVQAPHNIVRYTYRGSTSAAENLFYVNSITGEVSLSRTLQQDSAVSFYEVSQPPLYPPPPLLLQSYRQKTVFTMCLLL